MARGVKDAIPTARVRLMPVADGGDGLIDVLGGKLIRVPIFGPLGERRTAVFSMLSGHVSVVEMARASGLALVPPSKRDVMRSTSYGTGQLIAAALRAGAKTVVVGLGGSATNDGGAGLVQALGARLLDASGRELVRGAEPLERLARIEWRGAPRGVRFIAVSDVTNPLTGPRGSARVFGPQKGASAPQVRRLEKALKVWALRLKADLGRNVAGKPGAGASGGAGSALLAFLDAELVPGANWVLQRVGADKLIKEADLVLTGEGRLDRTSLYGKAPLTLARRAKRAVAVCGTLEQSAAPALRKAGLKRVVSFAQVGATPRDSMSRAGLWARRAAAAAVSGLLCLALTVPASAGRWDEADRLYFYRHEGSNLEKSLELIGEEKTPEAHWRRARALVRRGERAVKKKEKVELFRKAEEEARASIALNSDDPEAHFWLGIALGRQGQTRGVLKSLFLVKPLRKEMEEVLRLQPAHGGAHHVLGKMLMQLPGFAGGDNEEAVKHLEKAMELDAAYTAHYLALAEAYLLTGRKEKAVETLRKTCDVKFPADPAEFDWHCEDSKKKLAELER
jgi:glycerate kinase